MVKDIIADLGFPIFISLYLLIRIENTIKELTIAIQILSDNLSFIEKPNIEKPNIEN